MLFTWFGKSDRPVPTIRAPAAFASSGMISGVGFAIAKMIGSAAIARTMSGVSAPAALTPMNTSAPRITSASGPDSRSGFVIRAISSFMAFIRAGRPS